MRKIFGEEGAFGRNSRGDYVFRYGIRSLVPGRTHGSTSHEAAGTEPAGYTSEVIHIESVKGHLERHEHVASAWVAERNVDVWLPPGFKERSVRYPVLYMHDGQNLFDPSLSYSGVDWGLDERLDAMMAREGMTGVIVVGIWNTPHRIPEYMPQRPLERIWNQRFRERFVQTYGGVPCSDAYLHFIVDELKPFIDARYPTLTGQPDTFMMGSSMGGLISLYALCEYPHVFHGVGCLSTSWTVGGRLMLPYLQRYAPDPGNHRVYFDYGVEAHIGTYEQLQRSVNQIFFRRGYEFDKQILVERFSGAPHSESAWRERVDVPLRFLFNRYMQESDGSLSPASPRRLAS